MDKHSIEEMRVYSLVQGLEKEKYTESELQEIFGFECPLRETRLYKYIRMQPMDMSNKLFTVLKGELVTGEYTKGRELIKRGKYAITAVINGGKFTYVKH